VLTGHLIPSITSPTRIADFTHITKKVLLDLIFSVNKSFIYCNFLLYFKVNLFVINFEYKAGMFLKKK